MGKRTQGWEIAEQFEPRPSSDERKLIALTMTPEAAETFLKALSYAEARVHRHSEETLSFEDQRHAEKSAEWLRWGMGRLRYAVRGAGEGEPE